MSVFKDYAKYYNLLYKEKDYKSEIEYVSGLLKKHSDGEIKTVLNMGCGTGKHDRFLDEIGYSVDAFDMSEEMISTAKESNSSQINFFRSTIKDFKSEKKYDAIVSLFHVMSYQVKNKDVDAMFRVIKNNLRPGGSFLFDLWYGPAVLTDKPEERVKEIKAEEYLLKRTAIPKLKFNKNTVIVNYNVEIKDKSGVVIENIKESHNMRYFFIPEIKMFAKKNSCKITGIYEWMTTGKPKINSWNICITGTLK